MSEHQDSTILLPVGADPLSDIPEKWVVPLHLANEDIGIIEEEPDPQIEKKMAADLAEEAEVEDELFCVPEARLIGRLGVSRDTLREIRDSHLVENLHWKKMGKKIALSKDAEKVVRDVLSVPQAKPRLITGAEPEPEKKAPPMKFYARGEEAELTVVRGCRNPKIMLAVIDGKTVRVQVKSSVNFVPGMKFPAVKVADDLWTLTRPVPRYRGKW